MTQKSTELSVRWAALQQRKNPELDTATLSFILAVVHEEVPAVKRLASMPTATKLAMARAVLSLATCLHKYGEEADALHLIHWVGREVKPTEELPKYAIHVVEWDAAYEILAAEYLTPEEQVVVTKTVAVARAIKNAVAGTIVGIIVCAAAAALHII